MATTSERAADALDERRDDLTTDTHGPPDRDCPACGGIDSDCPDPQHTGVTRPDALPALAAAGAAAPTLLARARTRWPQARQLATSSADSFVLDCAGVTFVVFRARRVGARPYSVGLHRPTGEHSTEGLARVDVADPVAYLARLLELHDPTTMPLDRWAVRAVELTAAELA